MDMATTCNFQFTALLISFSDPSPFNENEYLIDNIKQSIQRIDDLAIGSVNRTQYVTRHEKHRTSKDVDENAGIQIIILLAFRQDIIKMKQAVYQDQE